MSDPHIRDVMQDELRVAVELEAVGSQVLLV
jgi:hypothetical protein